MQIPYEVSARPDTGLWNAKIGVWLFLASEVMLFGGLFSGYVFLRIGVTEGLDNPWPTRQLPVLPGFINTLVLIASSVFVVLAWSELKMRDFQKYQFWMRLVVLCALIFLGIKAYEYTTKFTHHGMKLQDNAVVEGILKKDRIEFKATEVTLNVSDDRLEFMDGLAKGGAEPKWKTSGGEEVSVTKGWMRKMRKAYAAAEKKEPGSGVSLVTLQAVEPVSFSFKPKKVRNYSTTELTYRDSAALKGELIDDKIYFEVHDIDMRMTDDVEHSLLWKYLDSHQKEAFHHHYENETAKAEKEDRPANPKDAQTMHIHVDDHGGHGEYPKMEVERADKKFLSNHGPAYNTYYAIYFTITGLHGLHVLIGAFVLAYFLYFQKALYKKTRSISPTGSRSAGFSGTSWT